MCELAPSADGRYWHWSIGLAKNGESATDPHRRLTPFTRAVWNQRRVSEQARSEFHYQSTSGGAHSDVKAQAMGADDWLQHLTRYDHRWSPSLERGATLTTSATIERVLLLRRVEMFSLLDEPVLAEISPWLEERVLEEGEVLFEEGELGQEMFIIAEGCLAMRREGRHLVNRGAMEIVGELAVLDVAPRSATACAIEPTRVLAISAEHLYQLMGDQPELVRGILRVLCRRLR